jgi:hypothetical protein
LESISSTGVGALSEKLRKTQKKPDFSLAPHKGILENRKQVIRQQGASCEEGRKQKSEVK